ncbi:MAG TPA: dienelactone hydrolase family protein [Polyangia bacterium]|nr:dienelactone hydrolase family protein [Polyangia bacterium]
MKLGGLQARVTGGVDGAGGGDGPVAVLCHGFGAPGDDLVALGPMLRAPADTRFVFPAAPLTVEGMEQMRAWWMIDLERLTLGARRSFDTAEVPSGLAEARARLSALLDDVERELHTGGRRLVLGGFSQGAMLALDVALHRAAPLAGLVLLSSTLIAEREQTPLLAARRGLPVLLAHGQEDPLLPFSVAETLRERLASAGLDVEWMAFRGGHEIPLPVLRAVGRFLARVAPPA